MSLATKLYFGLLLSTPRLLLDLCSSASFDTDIVSYLHPNMAEPEYDSAEALNPARNTTADKQLGSLAVPTVAMEVEDQPPRPTRTRIRMYAILLALYVGVGVA